MKNILGNKKLLGIIIAIIVAVALPVTLLQVKKQQEIRQRAAGLPVVFTFNPSSGTKAVNESFNMSLSMDTGGNQVRGLDFSFSFDRTYFEFVSFAKSNAFDQTIIETTPTQANTTGVFRYSAGTTSTPPNGAAVSIGAFVFKAKTQTPTGAKANIQFTNFEVIDPSPADLNANSLGAQFTISGSSSACKTIQSGPGGPCSTSCPNDCQSGFHCSAPSAGSGSTGNTCVPDSPAPSTATPTPLALAKGSFCSTLQSNNKCGAGLTCVSGACQSTQGGCCSAGEMWCPTAVGNQTGSCISIFSSCPACPGAPTPTIPPFTGGATATPTPLASTCALKSRGDANCDDKITILDFSIWKTEFLEGEEVQIKTADFDKNNSVNIQDFNAWKGGFLDSSLAH